MSEQRIAELLNTNEFLRDQVMEKERLCLELKKILKARDIGPLTDSNMNIRIPGENAEVGDSSNVAKFLTSNDSRFEIEYLKALDDVRLKSIQVEELTRSLETERVTRINMIKEATQGVFEKDRTIRYLQIALENAYKRTCELEDRLAKAKQCSVAQSPSSPAILTSFPRVNMNQTIPNRHSFSGPVQSTGMTLLSLNTSSTSLPPYPMNMIAATRINTFNKI